MKPSRRVRVAACALTALLVAGCTSSSPHPTEGPPVTGVEQATGATPVAIPVGWASISLGNVEVSVPGKWFVENPGAICGPASIGRVFLAEPPRVAENLNCARFATSTVTIGWTPHTSIGRLRPETVNGIAVRIGSYRRAGHVVYVERALGSVVTASGPQARAVLATTFRSPLSFVVGSPSEVAPADWRSVTFGGLTFAVPVGWKAERNTGWGDCPFNQQAEMLVLSSARSLAAPGCGGSEGRAASYAGVPGMVVGAGPVIPRTPDPGAHCLRRNGLRICIEPPPLHAATFYRGFNVLTAFVYPSTTSRPVEIALGLNGSGEDAAEIIDSLRAAS